MPKTPKFGSAPKSAYRKYGGKVEHSAHGVHVVYDSGWTVSIQWGAGNYCDNHRASFNAPVSPSSTAEVACWHNNGKMVQFDDGDTVQGWQSWEQVQRLLEAASSPLWNGPVGMLAPN